MGHYGQRAKEGSTHPYGTHCIGLGRGGEPEYVGGGKSLQQKKRGLKALDATERLARLPTNWEHKGRLAAVASYPSMSLGLRITASLSRAWTRSGRPLMEREGR